MISKNIHDDLSKSIKESFSEISEILKVLGNDKRLKILLFLLQGPQSYGSLVDHLMLKKTAVSNHLSHLIDVNLVERTDYGIYNISGDGIEFVKAIDLAFQNSPTRQLKNLNQFNEEVYLIHFSIDIIIKKK